MNKYITVVALLGCLLTAFIFKSEILENLKKTEKGKIIIIDDSTFWKNTSAIQFLDTLAKYGEGSVFVIEQFPDSIWIKNIDINVLLNKFPDNSKAAIVCSIYESNFHSLENTNTISEQIKYLCNGYREGVYPPSLCSFHYPRNTCP